MASSKTQLPVLLPRRGCDATDSTLSPARISPAKRANATTTPRPSANHALHHQVIVALTNLQGGLTHVQTGLNDLFRAYMQHTSSILAGENSDMDMIQLPANISATANAAMEAATTAAHGISQVVDQSNQLGNAVPETKKRKREKKEKKEKDPNAPKKPLTAAFLYAQTARPIVRSDIEAALGEGQAMEKNAVNLEVTKRWNELPEEDKEKWKASYRQHMEEYKIELADYLAKTGAKVADVHMEDASDADEVEAEVEFEAEAEAIDSDASSDSDDDDVPAAKSPTPPVKTPRPNKRIKVAAPPATTTTPVPIPGAARPAPVVPEPAAAKKDKKKKAGPQPIAPAPASSEPKESTPEEVGKPVAAKKAKTSRSTRGTEAEVDKENVAAAAPEKEKKKRSKRKSEVAA